MRRALWVVPVVLLAGLLGGCGQEVHSSNPAIDPNAPKSRCCGEPQRGPYPAVTYPSTTTKTTVPYPPSRPSKHDG